MRWGQPVSSYAIDDGEGLLLFDPIAPPGEILELAADRDPVVVLTAPWHERDTRNLVERLGAPVFVPPPDWLPRNVTREQIADWLRPLLALPVEAVLPTHGPPTDRAALERALA